jgi:hypothetical protein
MRFAVTLLCLALTALTGAQMTNSPPAGHPADGERLALLGKDHWLLIECDKECNPLRTQIVSRYFPLMYLTPTGEWVIYFTEKHKP